MTDSPGGTIYTQYQTTPNGGFNGAWLAFNGTATGSPALGINADGRMQLMVNSPSGTIYTQYQTAPNGAFNGTWQAFNGTAAGRPALVSNADGRMQLVVNSPGGTIYTQYQTTQNGNFNGTWVGLSGITAAADPDLGNNSDGRIQLMVNSSAGTIYTQYQTAPNQTSPNGGFNGTWTSMGSLPAPAAGTPTLGNNLPDGRLQLLTVSNGNVYTQYQTTPSGSFNGTWIAMGGLPAPAVGTLALGNNFDGRLQLMTSTSSGTIYTQYQTQPGGNFNGTWIAMPWISAGVPPAPINVTATAGQLSAVVRWTEPATSFTGISYVVTPYLGVLGQPAVTVGGGSSATVGNLKAGQSYSFTVTAQSTAGFATSQPSQSVTPSRPPITSGLGASLYYTQAQLSGFANMNTAFVSKDNLPTASSGWTVEGYLWNLSQASNTGSSLSWGALGGSSGAPGGTVAGLTLANGGTTCVWPGGSAPFPGTNQNGAPGKAYYAITWDAASNMVRCYANGTLQYSQIPTGSAALPSAPVGLDDKDFSFSGQLDEMRVSNVARYTGSTMQVPTSEFTVNPSTLALYHFDDYDTGRLGSAHITDSQGGWTHKVDGLYGDSTSPTAGHDLNWLYNGYSNFGGPNATVNVYSLGQGITAADVIGGGLPWICTCTRNTKYPVNTETGEFWHTFEDLQIPGRGLAVDWQRTYSSALASQVGRFGAGWNDSYNISVSFDGASPPNPTLHAGNGSSVSFIASGPPASPSYAAPSYLLGSLTKDPNTGNLTFADKAKTQYTFTAAGQLTQETDRNGYSTSLSYSAGKLSTVTAPGGISLTVTYDTTNSNLIHSITDSAGRMFTYAYDYTNVTLTQVTDAGHNTGANVVHGVWTLGYDGSHRMTSMQDPNCTATPTSCAYTPSKDTGLGVVYGLRNVYDASNRVIRQYDDRGVLTEFSYATDGDLVVPTNTTTITEHPTPSTSVSTVDVYTGGVLVSETKASGTLQAAKWLYGFDPTSLGQIMSVDPLGRGTITTRDAMANPLTITDPAGGVETLTYTTDGFNHVATDQDPVQSGTSIKTTYSYDSKGNLTQMSRPLDSPAGTLNILYNRTDANHPDDVITRQDGDGKVWTYTYDPNKGYLLTVADPMSPADVTHFAYDSAGRRVCAVAPKGNTTCPNSPIGTYETQYTYDASGGLTDVLAPLGHHSTAVFDANGNRTSATDADGNHTTYVYDAVDRPTKVIRADTSFETTSYDDLNNVTSQTRALASTTYFRFDYAYDLLNHLSSSTDNASPRRQTTYAYDAMGEQSSMTDPQSQTTNTLYDGAGRRSQVVYSDGVTPTASYVYDADGQRLTMTDGTGTTTDSWDSLHRMKQETNGAGTQVQFGSQTVSGYDFRGHVISITYPGTTGQVTRGYDNAGRMHTVTDWMQNTTTFNYDANSNLTSEVYPNGITATLTPDAADQTSQIVDTKGGNTPLNLNYTRDQVGDLKSENSTTYGYDSINRLTALGSNSYGYDAGDNLTQMATGGTQTYDGANQVQSKVTGSGTTTFAFDPRGNRTGITPPGGPTTNLTYDQANRMTGYGTLATYAYDGQGIRMSKTVSATTERFTYDSAEGLALIIQDGSTNYVTGPGGLPLEQISGATALYYHQDQLGSTRLLTNQAGLGVGTSAYDPYGNVGVTTGMTTPFSFAGQYRDTESGFYYLRARYYDPATGQFISRDPAVATTRQPYAYVADNPLNRTDPSGLWTKALCAGYALGAVFQFQEQWCISEDTRGGQAWTHTETILGFGSLALGLQLEGQGSNAECNQDLGEKFVYGGGGVNTPYLVGAGADAFAGSGPISHNPVVGAQGGLNVGFPRGFELHAGASNTDVHPLNGFWGDVVHAILNPRPPVYPQPMWHWTH